jgi:hypothetical protein
MLENYAVPQVPHGYIFQQDWTLVTEFLNEQFAGIWIGLGGPIQWLPSTAYSDPP